MTAGYYRLPLLFDELTKKKDLERCNLVHSIAQNIHLVLTSHYGENRNDPTYGCSIWEDEFSILIEADNWKSKLVESIKAALNVHERRIVNISVRVDIKQEELLSNTNIEYRIKRRMEVGVTGNLVKTNENYSFSEKFFIGPFSY